MPRSLREISQDNLRISGTNANPTLTVKQNERKVSKSEIYRRMLNDRMKDEKLCDAFRMFLVDFLEEFSELGEFWDQAKKGVFEDWAKNSLYSVRQILHTKTCSFLGIRRRKVLCEFIEEVFAFWNQRELDYLEKLYAERKQVETIVDHSQDWEEFDF